MKTAGVQAKQSSDMLIGFNQKRKGFYHNGYLVRLLRPFLRRRLSTACPSAVSILLRKPCLRFPFMIVGVLRFFFIEKETSSNYKIEEKILLCSIFLGVLKYLHKYNTEQGLVKIFIFPKEYKLFETKQVTPL